MTTIKQVIYEINVDTSQAEKGLEATAKQIDTMKKGVDSAGASLSAGTKKASEALTEQLGIIEKLRKEEEKLIKQRDSAQDPKKIKEYNQKIGEINTQIKTLTNTSTGAFKNITEGTESADRGIIKFSSSLQNLSVLMLSIGAAQGLYNLGKAALSTAGDLLQPAIQAEQTSIAFETMLKSGEKAAILQKQLRQYADTTPFNLPKIEQTGKTLLGFGFAVDDILPTLKMLGDISSGTGKDLTELSVIFGQIRTAGRAMTQDINQLAVAGIPVWDEIAKRFKISTAEARKFVEDGKVSFKDIKQILQGLTSGQGLYAGLTEKQGKTFGGLLSTFEDTIKSIQTKIGTALIPIFKDGLAQIQKAFGSLDVGMITNIFKTLFEVAKTFYDFALKPIGEALATLIIPLIKQLGLGGDETAGKINLLKVAIQLLLVPIRGAAEVVQFLLKGLVRMLDFIGIIDLKAQQLAEKTALRIKNLQDALAQAEAKANADRPKNKIGQDIVVNQINQDIETQLQIAENLLNAKSGLMLQRAINQSLREEKGQNAQVIKTYLDLSAAIREYALEKQKAGNIQLKPEEIKNLPLDKITDSLKAAGFEFEKTAKLGDRALNEILPLVDKYGGFADDVLRYTRSIFFELDKKTKEIYANIDRGDGTFEKFKVGVLQADGSVKVLAQSLYNIGEKQQLDKALEKLQSRLKAVQKQTSETGKTINELALITVEANTPPVDTKKHKTINELLDDRLKIILKLLEAGKKETEQIRLNIQLQELEYEKTRIKLEDVEINKVKTVQEANDEIIKIEQKAALERLKIKQKEAKDAAELQLKERLASEQDPYLRKAFAPLTQLDLNDPKLKAALIQLRGINKDYDILLNELLYIETTFEKSIVALDDEYYAKRLQASKTFINQQKILEQKAVKDRERLYLEAHNVELTGDLNTYNQKLKLIQHAYQDEVEEINKNVKDAAIKKERLLLANVKRELALLKEATEQRKALQEIQNNTDLRLLEKQYNNRIKFFRLFSDIGENGFRFEKTLEGKRLALQLEQERKRLAELQKEKGYSDKETLAQNEKVLKLQDEMFQKSKEFKKAQIMSFVDGVKTLIDATISALKQLNEAQINILDRQIEHQKKAIEDSKALAEKGHAEQLQAEQEKLDKLTKQREEYVRKQQALAVIELIANSTVAIAKAAAEGGIAAPFTIAATLIALIAGLAAAKATAQAAASGFEEGGYTGEGFGVPRSGERTKVAGVVHAREFVFNESATKENRDYFEAIHSGKLNLKNELMKASMFDKLKDSKVSINRELIPQIINIPPDLSEIVDELRETREALKGIGKTELHIDKRGVYAMVNDVHKVNVKASKKATL